MTITRKLSLITYALIVLGICLLLLVGLTSGVSASVMVVSETAKVIYSPFWSVAALFSFGI